MAEISLTKDKNFYSQVLHLMLPVVLQQAINMGVNTMDTIMLGSFGEAQLSASSLANSYYQLFIIFCLGVVSGCSVLVAQYFGKGDKEKIRETFALAMRLAAGVAILFTLLTALFPAQIMRFYTNEADVIAYGVRYLRITTCIFFLHGVSMIAAFLMRSVHKPRLGLVVSIISFFVNIGANYTFIFGKFGAPRMEIAGAALGTLIARAVEFAVTFIYILRIDKTLGLRLRHLLKNPGRELFYNYRRLGMAVLFSDMLLGFGNNAVNMVVGRIGAAVVAANAICQVMDRLCTVITAGMANASSIITGTTVGRGEKEKALEQGKTFYILSLGIGVFTSAVLVVFGEMMISAYNLQPETVTIAKEMMLAYGFIVFWQVVQNVMTKGVLRGGGDTRFLLVADILFMWILSLPLGILAAKVFGWPGWAVIICLRIDYLVKSIWCISRLHSGKWIRETKKLDS